MTDEPQGGEETPHPRRRRRPIATPYEGDIAVAGALDRLNEQLRAQRAEQSATDEKRAGRERLTLRLVGISVVLTFAAAWLSYCTLTTTHRDAADALSNANFYASAAISSAQRESAAAIEKAHGDAMSNLNAANTESQAALGKAEAANEISREGLYQVQRAFVYPSEMYLSRIDTAQQHGTGIQPVWTNSGNTPTRDLIFNIHQETRTTPIPRDYKFPNIDTDINGRPLGYANSAKSMLGPKASMKLQTAFISDADSEEMKEGILYRYIMGYAKYYDVFDRHTRHVTRFCVEAIVQDVYPHTAIGMQACRIGNCTDDECKRQGFD